VILGGDDTAADDEDIARTLAAKRLDQGRDQGLVAGRLARRANDVHVILDGRRPSSQALDSRMDEGYLVPIRMRLFRIYMNNNVFEWDDAKAAENQNRHGVSFTQEARALRDPFAVEWIDDRQE
jgi:hypothetical protein